VELAHDINLLHSAGIRVVLVHGSRPQIEAQLKRRRRFALRQGFAHHRPVALECVKEASAPARRDRRLLSLGLPNSPMRGPRSTRSREFHHRATDRCARRDRFSVHGTVRKSTLRRSRLLDTATLRSSHPWLLPTGEVFNLTMEDGAVATAPRSAEKLVFFSMRGRRRESELLRS